MKRVWFLIPALSLALGASLTELFDGVNQALLGVRPGAPQAQMALEKAQSLVRQAGPELPPVLKEAALTNLQEARAFLLRGDGANLEARLVLARHLLGKALFDAALKAGAAERPPLLQRLVQATGLPQGVAERARALPAEEARGVLEGGYLQLLVQDLDRALTAQGRPQAYLEVARAYARFIVIQDSPKSTLKAQDFVQTLAQIAAGEAFRPGVEGLKGKALAWRQALTPPKPAPAPQAQATQPAPAPQAQPAQAKAPKPQPAQAPAPQAQAPQAPAPSPPPASTPEAPTAPEAPKVELPEDIALLNLPPDKAQALARGLSQAGFVGVLAWLESLGSLRGDIAQAQIFSTSDPRWSRRILQNAYITFRARVLPVVQSYDPGLAERANGLFQAMVQAPALRSQDFTVLLREMQEVEERLFGRSLGFQHGLEVALTRAVVGIPRAIFFLLAAALAFFPLYLVRLTFGGRNVYWNLVALAFLFLLLPTVAEGLSYMGSLLAEYGGLPALALLSGLSIAQGLLPYLGWGVTVFLVVALAGAGLRGIARQFGLLKERDLEVFPSRETSPGLTSETVVEWDEEF